MVVCFGRRARSVPPCVCACVRARVRACVRACLRACTVQGASAKVLLSLELGCRRLLRLSAGVGPESSGRMKVVKPLLAVRTRSTERKRCSAVTGESGSRFDTSSFSKASSVYARGLSHEFGGYSAADWACRRLPARANVTPFLPSCVDYAIALRSGLDHCGIGRVPLPRLSGPTAGLGRNAGSARLA